MPFYRTRIKASEVKQGDFIAAYRSEEDFALDMADHGGVFEVRSGDARSTRWAIGYRAPEGYVADGRVNLNDDDFPHIYWIGAGYSALGHNGPWERG